MFTRKSVITQDYLITTGNFFTLSLMAFLEDFQSEGGTSHKESRIARYKKIAWQDTETDDWKNSTERESLTGSVALYFCISVRQVSLLLVRLPVTSHQV
jgi:hypothetical protein